MNYPLYEGCIKLLSLKCFLLYNNWPLRPSDAYICVIGSYNSLSLVKLQAIIGTNVGLLLIGALEASLSEHFYYIIIDLWSLVAHICVIWSYNGLSLVKLQATIGTDAGSFLTVALETNLSEIWGKPQ